MTFYDLQKNPLSPFLIRMIILLYQDKLNKLSNFNLSNLLHYLGILEIGADNKSARVNSSIYDSYNKNQFFQWVVCYHLDSLGLLYDHPRGYFDGISYIKTYWSPTTRVSIPAGFIPQTKYEFRKRKPKLSFRIAESLKFDPKSLMTITVEEVEELKRNAFLKQENHHYYLHSERNGAIKAINERHDLTSQQKKLRIARIEEKYQRNLKKYMEHVVSITRYSQSILQNMESDITQNEKSFIDLTTKLIKLKVAEQSAKDGEEKQLATKRRVEHEIKLEKEKTSLIQAKIRLEELKVYYQAISREATAAKQNFDTLELQELYFAGIKARKDSGRS